jgi:hypothetical protein
VVCVTTLNRTRVATASFPSAVLPAFCAAAGMLCPTRSSFSPGRAATAAAAAAADDSVRRPAQRRGSAQAHRCRRQRPRPRQSLLSSTSQPHQPDGWSSVERCAYRTQLCLGAAVVAHRPEEWQRRPPPPHYEKSSAAGAPAHAPVAAAALPVNAHGWSTALSLGASSARSLLAPSVLALRAAGAAPSAQSAAASCGRRSCGAGLGSRRRCAAVGPRRRAASAPATVRARESLARRRRPEAAPAQQLERAHFHLVAQLLRVASHAVRLCEALDGLAHVVDRGRRARPLRRVAHEDRRQHRLVREISGRHCLCALAPSFLA